MYSTGTVNNMTELLSALVTTCTANGWTLSGDVLQKDNLYLRAWVEGAMLRIRGGTGIDGTNALTGAATSYVQIGPQTWKPVTFPGVYHLFLFENEVYLILRHDDVKYLWLAFGKSTLDLPGTGMFFGGSMGQYVSESTTMSANTTGGNCCPALFYGTYLFYSSTTNSETSYVHHGMTTGSGGNGWEPNAYVAAVGDQYVPGIRALVPHYGRLPNAWNNGNTMLPMVRYVFAPENKTILLADLENSRHIRIDNLDPEQVITFGTDEWMVFPWVMKNNKTTATSSIESGVFGWAIRKS